MLRYFTNTFTYKILKDHCIGCVLKYKTFKSKIELEITQFNFSTDCNSPALPKLTKEDFNPQRSQAWSITNYFFKIFASKAQPTK